jgi:hypothetical protein
VVPNILWNGITDRIVNLPTTVTGFEQKGDDYITDYIFFLLQRRPKKRELNSMSRVAVRHGRCGRNNVRITPAKLGQQHTQGNVVPRDRYCCLPETIGSDECVRTKASARHTAGAVVRAMSQLQNQTVLVRFHDCHLDLTLERLQPMGMCR